MKPSQIVRVREVCASGLMLALTLGATAGQAAGAAAAATTLAAPVAGERSAAPDVDWPFRGGDAGASQYSPLADIDTGNVVRLNLSWAWSTGEKPLPEHGVSPGMFETTPLMIDGTLYLTTPYNRVVALDPATGRERWAYDPRAYEEGQPPNGTGFVHRGLAAWRDPRTQALRLLLSSRHRLVQLDAASGKPVGSFGAQGVVDLLDGLAWKVDPRHYTNTSPPAVYKNLVIVGNGVADKLIYRNDPPGDVRAYDLRSGRRVWTFHTVPRDGEPGSETWQRHSNRYTGHTNVWAPMSVDLKRGLVYLPVSTPSNDYFGGNRPGANLYADSLVCLEAKSGKLRWHRQLVHHGLWDYDAPAAPMLVRLTQGATGVDAVLQLTKQGFVFGFERATGRPLWPIEERPVPASDVPGEVAHPTQAVTPTMPALVPQGVSLDDATDLTPELHAQALAVMRRLRLGPLFTPPSREGTLARPGVLGGADWGGGAFDPLSGVLYAKVNNDPQLIYPDITDANGSAPEVGPNDATDASLFLQRHIPLLKPPYAFLDALDLNAARMNWQVPFGDTRAVRRHPALQGVKLPPALGAVGSAGAIVTAGGLVFAGGGDTALHAVDARTGAELWRHSTRDARVNATPMTYRAGGRQYVVVAVGGPGPGAKLLAFTLGDHGAAPLTADAADAAAVSDAPAGPLTPAEGKAVFERACSECHSLDTVLKKRRTPAQWQAQIDVMLAKGAKLSDAQADAVARYLSTEFGAAAD
jgi:quinoprotein glucose dehydrogenase